MIERQIVGTTDTITKYVRDILKQMQKVSLTDSMMSARAHLMAAERFSTQVRVECRLDIPKWSIGTSITAYVPCTFFFARSGASDLFHRNVFLCIDSEAIWFSFFNNNCTYRLPVNEVPRFYPGHSPDSLQGRRVYQAGWNNNDLCNTLAEIAFRDALEKVFRAPEDSVVQYA